MKLKASYETEAYLSQGGYYAIKQLDWDGREQVILLTPAQLEAISEDMKAALVDPSWFDQVEE